MTNYKNPHAPMCHWYEMAESQGAPNIKWCEETLCQFISEPANTWSNLGYLLIGLYLVTIAYKKNYSNNLKCFGPIVFLMGLGSYFYHLSNYYTTQLLDFIGMFLFVGWTLGMNLIRLKKLQSNNLYQFIFGAVIVSTVAIHFMYLQGWLMQMTILVYGVLIFVTELMVGNYRARKWKWFVATITTLLIAFFCSYLDHSNTWCNPQEHGWFSHGHALWHWISSIAMIFIFKHFEQFQQNSQNQKIIV